MIVRGFILRDVCGNLPFFLLEGGWGGEGSRITWPAD